MGYVVIGGLKLSKAKLMMEGGFFAVCIVLGVWLSNISGWGTFNPITGIGLYSVPLGLWASIERNIYKP